MGNFLDKLFGKDNGSPDERYPNRCRLFMVIDKGTNTIMTVSKGKLTDPSGWGNPDTIADLRVEYLLNKHHFIPDEFLYSWVCDDIKKTPDISNDGKEFAEFLRYKRAEKKISLREYAFRKQHNLKAGDVLPKNEFLVWCGKQERMQITEDYGTVIKGFRDQLEQLHFTKEEDVQQIGNVLERFGNHPDELNGIFEVWLETDSDIRIGWFKKLDRLIFSLKACKKQRLDDLRSLLKLRGDQIQPMHELAMQGYRNMLAERVGKAALVEQMKTTDGKNYIDVRKWIYQYHKDNINCDEQDIEFEMDNEFVDLLKFVGDRLQQEETQRQADQAETPRAQLMFGSTDGKANTVVSVAAQPTIPTVTHTAHASVEEIAGKLEGKDGTDGQASTGKVEPVPQDAAEKPVDETAPERATSDKPADEPASADGSTPQQADETTPGTVPAEETGQGEAPSAPDVLPQADGVTDDARPDREAPAAGKADTPDTVGSLTDAAPIAEALEALANGEPLSDEFLRWKDLPEVTASQLAWVFEQPYISNDTLISSGVFSSAIRQTRYFQQLEARLVDHTGTEDSFSDTDQQILSVYLESLNREQQYATAYIQNHPQGGDEKLKSMRVRMLTRQTLIQDLEKIVMRWSDKRKEMHVAQSRDRLLEAFKAIAGGEMLDPDAGRIHTLETDLRMVDGNKPVLLVLTDALMELSQAKAAAQLVKVLKSCVVRIRSYANLDTICLNNLDKSPMDLLYVALCMLDYQYETIPLYQKKIRRIKGDVISYFEERGYKIPSFICQDLAVAEIDLEMGEGIMGVYRQAYSYLHDVYRDDVVADYFDVEKQVKAIREEAEAKREALKEKKPAKRKSANRKREPKQMVQPTIDQLLNVSLSLEEKIEDNLSEADAAHAEIRQQSQDPALGESSGEGNGDGRVESGDTDPDAVIHEKDTPSSSASDEEVDGQHQDNRLDRADESVEQRQEETLENADDPEGTADNKPHTVPDGSQEEIDDESQEEPEQGSASEDIDVPQDESAVQEETESDLDEEDPLGNDGGLDLSEPEFKPSDPLDDTSQTDDNSLSDEEAERMVETASESSDGDDIPEGAEEVSREESEEEPEDDEEVKPASVLERMEERYGVTAKDADILVGYDPVRDVSHHSPVSLGWKWELSHTKRKLGPDFLLFFNQIDKSDNKEAKAFLCCCGMRMKEISKLKRKLQQHNRIGSLVNFIRMKLVILKNPSNDFDRAVIVHLVDIMNMLNS